MSTNEQQASALASWFRTEHGLGDAPVKDMFELAHAADIDVLSMDADQAEHGLSMTDPVTLRTVIAVATTPHPMRQRSSIAHEVGHVLAGDLDRVDPLVPGERSPEEIRADSFARHLLLPLGAVRQRFVGRAPGLRRQDLSDLVQEFEVSPAMASIQLRNVKLIDPETCAQWSSLSASQLATQYGWRSQYNSLAADSAQPRAPQSLMTRAVEGYRRGVLGITELATWYGQNPNDLEQDLGPGPHPDPDDWDDDWDTDAPLFPGDPADAAS